MSSDISTRHPLWGVVRATNCHRIPGPCFQRVAWELVENSLETNASSATPSRASGPQPKSKAEAVRREGAFCRPYTPTLQLFDGDSYRSGKIGPPGAACLADVRVYLQGQQLRSFLRRAQHRSYNVGE